MIAYLNLKTGKIKWHKSGNLIWLVTILDLVLVNIQKSLIAYPK